MTKRKLISPAQMICILAVAGSAFTSGIRIPVLYSPDPFEFFFEDVPELYRINELQVKLGPGVLSGLLTYRLYYGNRVIGSSRAAETTVLADRIISYSLRESWRKYSSSHCIRSSRADGSLLPTIYLPLEMPSFLSGAIGEGGQIDISGHQKITLSGVSHIYPDRPVQEGENRSLFPDLKMEQELRVMLDGTVGEKIHINVDHDSERQFQPENRVKLSYDGDDDEIIQSIEMGDVSLSISGPEFVSYSIPHEGLFGAKMNAQVGPMDFTVIASRESSTTESADFVGQATAVTDTILDIHTADNYFYLMFPDTLAQRKILNLEIFVDDINPYNDEETGAVYGVYFTNHNPYDSSDTIYIGSGNWDVLQPGFGQDYVLSDDSLYIRFLSPINNNYRLAVWMVTLDGSTPDTIGDISTLGAYDLKLIKESNPIPDGIDSTWAYEMRNFYFMGANNIVRESFDCNIFYSGEGGEPVSLLNDVPLIQVLGLDTNGDGSLVDEDNAVDWDNGFLVFGSPGIYPRPFVSDSLPENWRNPEIYEKRNPVPADSKFFMEVSYSAASTTYSLGHIGIVEGSERVVLTVAGQAQTLQRNVDYTIIYEIGLLTLMGEAAEFAQDPSNSLKVTYEYTPFISFSQKTLLGTRVVYELGDYSWLGATAMYESAKSPEDRPRVGEESSRTVVADFDSHFELRPDILTSIVNCIPGINTEAQSRVVLSGEIAASFPNPNTLGRAYIDDMEGAESSIPFSTSRSAWHFGSLPFPSASSFGIPGALRWYNNDVYRWRYGDILLNPPESEEFKDVGASSILEISFDPAGGSPDSWGSIIRCIDKYGVDYSRKTHLHLYIMCTAEQADLYLDLGEWIDEDSWWPQKDTEGISHWTANGILDSEVEDPGIVFNSSQHDTGYDEQFDSDEPGYDPSSNPDPHGDNYSNGDIFGNINGTEGNSKLDTEDLNRNGYLDRNDSFFRISIPLDDPEYIVEEHPETGWKLIEIPLNDSLLVSVPGIVSGTPTWEKISYARIWFDGFSESDTIHIYDLSIVGNRWEPMPVVASGLSQIAPGSDEEILISTKNNRENYDYMQDPPPGIDPGEDENGDKRLEQSIVLILENIRWNHEGFARQLYYSAENYTGYSSIRFLVHGDNNTGSELFYRLGKDSLNFYEINVELEEGWQIIQVDFTELTDLKEIVPDSLQSTYYRQGNIAVIGSPNLGNIMQMNLGVRNTEPGTILNTEVWVDDITLHGPYGDTGTAKRLTTSFDFADFLILSGDIRDVDENFHSLGSSSGQGFHSTTISTGSTLNLHKFTPPLWSLSFPATFSWNRNISRPRFGSSSDIRLSREDSWEHRTQDDSWNTSITTRKNSRSATVFGRYLIDPFRIRHTFSMHRGRTWNTRDSSTSTKIDLSYSVSPGQMRLFRLPVLEEFRLRPTNVSWSIVRSNSWDTKWDHSSGDTIQTRLSSTRRLQTNGSVSFRFWKGLNSSYSLGLVRNLFYPWDRGLPFNIGREVSRNQHISLSQDINLFNLFQPRFSWDSNYSMARLAPHTSGIDSLGTPDVSLSNTRKLSLRIGLVHMLKKLSRLRDERLDEGAVPGSPRWLLMKLERWADRITDPSITFSRSYNSDYRDLDFLPGFAYQCGLETELEDVSAFSRSKQDLFQVSGGLRPVSTMSLRVEYSRTISKQLYSGYWNRQDSKTWPNITLSWSGLERVIPFNEFTRSMSISSGYRVETSKSGRFENEIFQPTTETRVTRWSPLLSISTTLKNDVRISLSDNHAVTETINFTGTEARTRSSNHSTTFSISYSFSAPGGIAIPLPLLDRLRISFQSDLTTGLDITRSRNNSEIIGGGLGDQIQSDRIEWRIEPSANYDFGSVTAGLRAVYAWKTDNVNSYYNQRDIGMDIWILLNF